MRSFVDMATNHKIDHVILSAQWEIDRLYGLQMLAGYFADLAMLETDGVTFADLGYSEQRASLQPSIVGLESSSRASLSSPDVPLGSIAHLRLSGVMRLENGFSSRGIRQLSEDIAAADANPRIHGIIIEVNSGGGESIAGTELQNSLRDVQERGQTKTAAYVQLMASAALRGLLPVDYIQASSKSAFVGSIGTYTTVNRKLLNIIRDNYQDIYARQATLKNNEYRELLAGNAGPLIDRLTQQNQIFIDEVLESRVIRGSSEDLQRVTAGALFPGSEALRVGLIDGIGTFRQVVQHLESRIDVRKSVYQNFNSMNFKEYLQKLVPSLNSKLGLEIKEDASADEVLSAVEAAQSVSEATEAVREEVQKYSEEATEGRNKLSERMDNMEQTIKDLTAKNEALETSNKSLEGEIADIKGTRENQDDKGGKEQKTDTPPKVEQFETAKAFMNTRKTGRKSKYGKK